MKTEETKKQEYICYTQLKDRWNKKLIDKFYPKPDLEKVNPYYKCASPMKLYSLKKVERIEKYKRFIKMKEELEVKGAKAREGAKKAVETKREKSMNYAKSVKIKIPTMEREKLEKVAYDHWYSWNADRYDFFYDGNPSEETLKRWCVNYLRHQCTTYDKNLRELYGSVGVQEAHDLLKFRINEAIYKKYPWLIYE